MKFGFILPSGDARIAAEFAAAAEDAGWDGFFVWEPIYGWDAWVMLTAAAMRTQRIRLGTMITPVSRMRPWKLASETLALDHLSNGRVTLSVGLGAPEVGFPEFGEAIDRRARAELLDEGLAIIEDLWSGRPFTHAGKHYHVDGTHLHYPPPPPVQQPRIPIWVVGAWPFEKSMQRALRYDGIIPSARGDDGDFRQVTQHELHAMKDWIDARRGEGAFDIIVEGTTSTSDPEQASATARQWADAGATWINEAMWMATGPDLLDQLRRRIEAGPPRID